MLMYEITATHVTADEYTEHYSHTEGWKGKHLERGIPLFYIHPNQGGVAIDDQSAEVRAAEILSAGRPDAVFFTSAKMVNVPMVLTHKEASPAIIMVQFKLDGFLQTEYFTDYMEAYLFAKDSEGRVMIDDGGSLTTVANFMPAE